MISMVLPIPDLLLQTLELPYLICTELDHTMCSKFSPTMPSVLPCLLIYKAEPGGLQPAEALERCNHGVMTIQLKPLQFIKKRNKLLTVGILTFTWGQPQPIPTYEPMAWHT